MPVSSPAPAAVWLFGGCWRLASFLWVGSIGKKIDEGKRHGVKGRKEKTELNKEEAFILEHRDGISTRIVHMFSQHFDILDILTFSSVVPYLPTCLLGFVISLW